MEGGEGGNGQKSVKFENCRSVCVKNLLNKIGEGGGSTRKYLPTYFMDGL